MDRRVHSLISPNPDINTNREWQWEWIKSHNLTPYITTKADIAWFWQDLDLEVDSQLARDFVDERFAALNDQYPFLLTEFFEEFYRYMPECLANKWDKVGELDWNLFFTLVYPLPPLTYVPFHTMTHKLNLAQLRLVKVQIVNEIWENEDLRHRVLHEEVLPALYTQYLPYWTIRTKVIEKDKQETRRMEEEKKIRMGGNKLPDWMKAAYKRYQEGTPIEEIFTNV